MGLQRWQCCQSSCLGSPGRPHCPLPGTCPHPCLQASGTLLQHGPLSIPSALPSV